MLRVYDDRGVLQDAYPVRGVWGSRSAHITTSDSDRDGTDEIVLYGDL